MGKTIIQQARGHGSLSYRVRRKSFNVHPSYLTNMAGEYEVIKFISTAGHTSPIAKFRAVSKDKDGKFPIFHNFAPNGLFVGQKIKINGENNGDIVEIGLLKNGTKVFNMELRAKDGGKLVRTAGNYATIINKDENKKIVTVQLPSKKEKQFEYECRVTIGEIAGHGRLEKPFLKAGRKFYLMRARSKLWPRTSAIKFNAIDHPFGSGRGKRIKSKIAKNNSPPGAKVGLLHPRRTGRRKK